MMRGASLKLHTEVRFVLLLLFERKLIESLSYGKLAIDAFLGDIEVFDVEETIFSDCLDQNLRELLSTLWRMVKAQVDSNKVGPI